MLRHLPHLLGLFMTLIIALPVLAAEPKGSIEIITPKEAAHLIKSKGDELLIIDVRTPKEFEAGHIPDARNMNLFGTQFEVQMDKLPRGKDVLLYCRTGARSAGAADLFKDAGFKVWDLKDGLSAWQKAKMPVTKGSAAK